MPTLIKKPAIVKASGNKPKVIEEYIGRISSETGSVSIARMLSPGGWKEPGQTPEFDEYTVVIRGILRVETKDETFELGAGKAMIAHRGEWVRYSTPGKDGAEYLAVCLPAFSPALVRRDER